MAPKRVSRKKLLKEPDEFISTTGKILQFLRERRRQMAIYGIIALAVVASAFAGYSYLRWQEGKAQAIQQQAFQFYQEASRRGDNPEGEKENYQKALEKFREALSVYSWGRTAQVARIYIGYCHYALKEYDQALASYSQCLDGPFQPMAFNGMGYSYEAKGDFAKALDNYQKNAEEDGNPYQEEGLLGIARCYEALNQQQKALGAYQKSLSRNPKSRLADFIQWKIGELKG
ncbi:MAG: tetratricopeptide repeat protein [Deltaproteobacteria bacterium]|nr:tetratricopeptide repeat protein [Deltaproteobacteria bacterium]